MKPPASKAARWFLKIPGIQAVIDGFFTHEAIKEIMANPNLTSSQKKRLVGETVFNNLGGFLGGASGAAIIAGIGTTLGLVPGAGWAAAIASYILAVGAWIGGEWAGNKMAQFLGDQWLGDDGKESLGASIISSFGYDPDGDLLSMLPDSAMGPAPGMSAKPGLLSNLSPDGTIAANDGSVPGFSSRAGGYQGQLLLAKMSRQGLLGDIKDLPIDHEFSYTDSGLVTRGFHATAPAPPPAVNINNFTTPSQPVIISQNVGGTQPWPAGAMVTPIGR